MWNQVQFRGASQSNKPVLSQLPPGCSTFPPCKPAYSGEYSQQLQPLSLQKQSIIVASSNKVIKTNNSLFGCEKTHVVHLMTACTPTEPLCTTLWQDFRLLQHKYRLEQEFVRSLELTQGSGFWKMIRFQFIFRQKGLLLCYTVLCKQSIDVQNNNSRIGLSHFNKS